jgi:hypothetical protein
MTLLGLRNVQITISPKTALVIVGLMWIRRIKFIASIQKKIKKSLAKACGIEKYVVSL